MSRLACVASLFLAASFVSSTDPEYIASVYFTGSVYNCTWTTTDSASIRAEVGIVVEKDGKRSKIRTRFSKKVGYYQISQVPPYPT